MLLETARGGWRRVRGTKRVTVYSQYVAAERGRAPIVLFEAWPAERVSIELRNVSRLAGGVPIVAFERHAKQHGSWWLSMEPPAAVGEWSPWFSGAAPGSPATHVHHLVAEDLEAGDAPLAFAVGLAQTHPLPAERARKLLMFGIVEALVTVARS